MDFFPTVDLSRQYKSKPKYGLETQVTPKKHTEVKKRGKQTMCFQFHTRFYGSHPFIPHGGDKAMMITMMMIIMPRINYQLSLNERGQAIKYNRQMRQS